MDDIHSKEKQYFGVYGAAQPQQGIHQYWAQNNALLRELFSKISNSQHHVSMTLSQFCKLFLTFVVLTIMFQTKQTKFFLTDNALRTDWTGACTCWSGTWSQWIYARHQEHRNTEDKEYGRMKFFMQSQCERMYQFEWFRYPIIVR